MENKKELIRKEVIDVCKSIFENINLSKSEKFRINNNYLKIKCKDNSFSSKSLLHIAKKIKRIVSTYRYTKITVVIDLTLVENFLDKNTYLILDLFIFYMIYNCEKCNLYIHIDTNLENVIHNGITSTALFRSINTVDGNINRSKFLDEYVTLYITQKTYRRLITKKSFDDSTSSKVTTDIETILKNYFDETWVDEICEIISEIVCNAYSHNLGLLLIDVDICDDITKMNSFNSYKALNISVLNFGENVLYGKILENVKLKKYKDDDDIYNKVYKAYENHKNFFNENYTEEAFFSITAFQKRVTSRYLESGNSGTGLTRLIQNITGKTELNLSYVLSGKTVISFKSEFLNVSKDGFVGFNNKNNYIEDAPDDEVLSTCSIFIPGTIYQLHLIKRD